MNKKNIFLWTLYDFANSIFTIVFFLYFGQWLVIEHGVSDFWYNMIFVGSSILLIATAPVGGIIADKLRLRMPFLRVTTASMFGFALVAGLIANFSPEYFVWAGIAYMIANYFFQFSFSFYNPLLHDIAPLQSQGRISGLGLSANWLGQISGLLITLPLASGAIYLIGDSSARAQTFLPSAVLFFVLALPMLVLFKDPVQPIKVRVNIKEEYKNFFGSFRELIKTPGVGRFLLGYFLFNDAVLTAQNNFPIYMEQVWRVSDKTKSLLLIGILATSIPGALISGWLADKIGLKKTLLLILTGWAVVFPILALVTSFTYFVVATIVMGFLFGAVWTVTRAVMSYLSPSDKLNYSFSFYTMAERFSTFIGPVTWGTITLVFVNFGSLRYRFAIIFMAVFIVLGLLIVRKIPSQPNNTVIDQYRII